MRLERMAAIALLAAVAVVFVARNEWRKAHPPEPTAEQKQYVDVSVERALFDAINVRVIISARIRPGAKVEKVDFVHVSGYFVDQDGTRYSPGFTQVDNRQLPTTDEIERTDVHELRLGETYRYCLGPAGIRTSKETLATAITKITVYLDGQQPQEVPVSMWRDLDPTSDDFLRDLR